MADNYLSKRRTNAVKVNYDDKKGLGYGVLDPKFHRARSQNSNYPYVDPDTHPDTDEQIDADSLDMFVKKTNMGYHITDFMANKKNNPFYFVAGNTKLSEISTNSMVPIPDLYRGREVSLGGTTPGYIHIGAPYPSRNAGVTQYGTKRGLSKAPPALDVRTDIHAYSVEDILPSDEDTMEKLRMLISDIHREQENNS